MVTYSVGVNINYCVARDSYTRTLDANFSLTSQALEFVD